MNYLIAIDSDGTLRRSDGTISDVTKKAIFKQIKNNNVVVICTARPRYHTLKIAKEVGASNYLISSNGSELYDFSENKLIWATYVNKEDCIKLYKYSKKENIRIMFVIENTEYVTQFIRDDAQILLNDENFDKVLEGNVKQIMVIGKDKEKIENFKNIVINEYKLNILDSSSKNKEEMWFSIVGKKASKGIALLKLAEYLNISSDNIVSIGNDNNDISMFEVAKISVVVSNSTENALKKAKYITESNDNDGVALFLEQLYKEIL